VLADATIYRDQAHTRYRTSPGSHPMPAPAERGARWVGVHHDRPLPDDSDVAPVELPVVVNHGRWVVRCPCGGAQHACRTDRRMFCVDCRNGHADGRWVLVRWPDNPEEIEQLLEGRPVELQNWDLSESAGMLRAENDLLVERARAGRPLGVAAGA